MLENNNWWCIYKLFLGFFYVFDENWDNYIDFKEMVCGILVCCRGFGIER